MTFYNSLYAIIRGIGELLSSSLKCLCCRPEERRETSYFVPNSYEPFVGGFHWQTYNQQFPPSYDTPSIHVFQYTCAETECVIVDLTDATRYSETIIHSAAPLTAPQVEENSRKKGSHYYRHGHRRRERSYSLNGDPNTQRIHNNSRSRHRKSDRCHRSEKRQIRDNIISGGGSMQETPLDIVPRKLPRERSGILRVNADDISNSSHEAVSGKRSKIHRVRFA